MPRRRARAQGRRPPATAPTRRGARSAENGHPALQLQREAGNEAVRSLLSVQRDPPEGEKAAAAVGGTATKVWWPSLIGKKTAPTADEQAALNDTVTRRSGLSVRSDLKTVPFTAGGVTSTGYQYGGKKATPKTPATDPLHKLALAEFGWGRAASRRSSRTTGR